MTNKKISRIGLTVAATALAAVFSSCNSSSSSTPAQTPCTNISDCTATANGYQFPDGDGGTVTCGTNGNCVDSTYAGSYNSGYSAGYNNPTAYNDGYSDGYNDGYNSGYDDGYNAGYASSVSGNTKDTDLQKANAQQKSVEERAQYIADQFSMSVGKAMELTQLSDRVQQMAASGQMTADDRAAVTQSALGIAGLTVDQVNSAITRMNQGDTSAASALMEKAATNLGMPSSVALRDKLLPALGVNMN